MKHPRISSPPLPLIRGCHYALSRPPRCSWRYRHEFVVSHGQDTEVWQFLGWQFFMSPCPHQDHIR
jgi:hypothetical protein